MQKIIEIEDLFALFEDATTVIFGGNGKGKSSLASYIANEFAFYHKRIRKGHIEIDKINIQKSLNIEKPEHLTYMSGVGATFKKLGYSERPSIPLYPERLGIQKEAPKDFKCQAILPYSTLFIDEMPTWFSSRSGHVKDFQASFFEKRRHFGLTIIGTATRAKLVDLRIRDIAQGIHVLSRKIEKTPWQSLKITWTVNFIEVGEIDSYVEAPPDRKQKYAKKLAIVCDKDIFKIYDAESCKVEFYDDFTASDWSK